METWKKKSIQTYFQALGLVGRYVRVKLISIFGNTTVTYHVETENLTFCSKNEGDLCSFRENVFGYNGSEHLIEIFSKLRFWMVKSNLKKIQTLHFIILWPQVELNSAQKSNSYIQICGENLFRYERVENSRVIEFCTTRVNS